MERARRLASFWSWLPAFRAVAETQHLPTASRALHVSPSALSRTIRLLEEDMGRPLFDRVGRRIVLNDAGEALLASVRDAMRMLDEGLGVVTGSQLLGPVHVSAPGPFVPLFVLPAVEALRRSHQGLVPHLHAYPSSETGALLLRGGLDVALLDDPPPAEGLHVEALREITHGVYCGPRHPLKRVGRPSRERLLGHDFVAPPADADGVTPDGWPPGVSRRIALRVDRMQAGVDACLRGALLCALPDVVAARAGLRRLPFDPLRSTTLYLVHRPSLPLRGKADALADALRTVVRRPPD